MVIAYILTYKFGFNTAPIPFTMYYYTQIMHVLYVYRYKI